MVEKKITDEQKEEKILEALKKNPEGLNITHITEKSGISRSFVRTAMYKLEGQKKVKLIEVGMSKLYRIN